MKKYIPYIVIPLIAYLLLGFIKMQFNPAYWEQQTRINLMIQVGGSMLIYRIFKLME